MADLDSTETFGNNSGHKGFSAQNFKNFSASPHSNLLPSSQIQSSQENHTAEKSGYVLNERDGDSQLSEVVQLPFDIFKQALYGLVPFLAPHPKDTAQEQAQKQRHLDTLRNLDQETRQIYLRKVEAWKQRQEQDEQERHYRSQTQAEKTAMFAAVAPTGKKSGAHDPHAQSQKANTADLLKRQRTANADRTQSAS